MGRRERGTPLTDPAPRATPAAEAARRAPAAEDVLRAEGAPRLTAPSSLRRLLAGAPEDAARSLLGCSLSAGGVTVRITEVEAYAGVRDAASHAFRGRTERNAVMFGPAGFAYVYFTYGMHWCVNVVCGNEGEASAVLVRAGEVVRGLATARARRPAAKRDVELARGPARLCSALGITREHYGVDLLAPESPLRLRRMRATGVPPDIVAGPRVGVTGAPDVPWRFWYADDPTVSTYRRHTPRPDG